MSFGNFLNSMGTALANRFDQRWNNGLGGMMGQIGPDSTHQGYVAPQAQPPMGATPGGINTMGPDGNTMTVPGTGNEADATRQQDAMARQHGFNNYNEMLLWARQRAGPHDSSVAGNGMGAPGGSAAVNVPTWRNKVSNVLNDVFAWHPSHILNGVTDAINGATGQ